MRKDINVLVIIREYQIVFFESYFIEFKFGWFLGVFGILDILFRWCVGGQIQWSVEWVVDVWYNVVYEIDFVVGIVGFWYFIGSDFLIRKVVFVKISISFNGVDWYVGVLEFLRSGYFDFNEDFYWFGVYIESGSLIILVVGFG